MSDPALDPGAFRVERARVRDQVELAFVHEGVGGFPLLLVHGWPETKRIWWRNVAALADAGFEVIAPDLRGFGDSSGATDGCYDMAANARDLHALLMDTLGHERCVACGGDWGGVVMADLALRFPGLVVRQIVFNAPTPLLPEQYAEAGLGEPVPREVRQAADYFIRQGRDADALAAELATPELRRRYVAGMYGHRFWAAPGSFLREEVDFHTEPFGDAERVRSSIAVYEHVLGTRTMSEPPRFAEPVPVPTVILYGPEDHVVQRDFPERAAVAYPDHVGPFLVPRAGHFLQWERAEVLNATLTWFCRDLLVQSAP